MSDGLARLAEFAGIAPSFRDYFGNETWVGDTTKMALLTAMGYDVSSEDAIASAIERIENEPWTRVLAPVTMLETGRPVLVACALPSDAGSDEPSWRIEREEGATLQGIANWRAAFPMDARTVGGRRFERRRLEIGVTLPLGYHRLTVCCAGAEGRCTLIVVPPTCYVRPTMRNGRVWALATQLYALRSEHNWGIGDFRDLAELATLAGAAGAGAVALNPLHELHPANPQAASPYAPSSRLFLNTLYIDASSIADGIEAGASHGVAVSPSSLELEALRTAEFVDYAGVSRAKHAALTRLFRAFCVNHLERPGDRRAARFRVFVREGGLALERLARYEALSEHFRAADAACYGWLQWPPAYRSPESPDVDAFARRHRDRVEYFTYLQWVAAEQLAAAAQTAREHGVGLYRDLAVGADLNGSDAWSDRSAFAIGASLGAPPDPLNTYGQNWGLPPLSPPTLRQRAYEPFAALLRANMHLASVIRIDHVMALARAFWIPHGRLASEGAYVRYDLDEMLGVLALESVRNACVVVGEDLGTLPEGFRDRLIAAGTLSSRLLYFERAWDAGASFLPPHAYPRLAAASVGTHDLPPLAGWWLADDIALRVRIGLSSGEDCVRTAYQERHQARFLLIDALQRDGDIDAASAARLRDDAQAGGTPLEVDRLSTAVHRFLARTPSMLATVAIEDVLGEVCAVNVPGTVDEHPNWRRKRSLSLEDLKVDGRLFRIGTIMCDTGAGDATM